MSGSKPTGLERVRELREHAEDLAREAFASSLSDRVRGVALLRAAEDAVKDSRSVPALGAPLGVTELLAREHWSQRLTQSREQAALTVDRLDAEVEARRVALEHAGRDREMLVRACDRRSAEAARDLARREAAEMDDMAATRRRAA